MIFFSVKLNINFLGTIDEAKLISSRFGKLPQNVLPLHPSTFNQTSPQLGHFLIKLKQCERLPYIFS